MPPVNCPACGAPFETVPDLTMDSMRRSLFYSRLASWIAFSLATISTLLLWILRPSPQYVVPYEATGPGIVRYVDKDKHLLLHENNGGYLKALSPLCTQEPPVWTNMRVNITFRWGSSSCYDIISVQRIGPDATLR